MNRQILFARRGPGWHVLLICLLVGIAVSTDLRAQSRRDSLWQVWNDTTQPDTHRLKAIQAITWPMLTVNLDSVYILANLQLDFARRIHSDKWIGRALYNLATHYFYKGDLTKAFDYYEQSLPYRIKTGDKKGIAAIYGNFGLIYSEQGNLPKSAEFLQKALALNLEIGDRGNITSNYNNLALLYHQLEDTTRVLEYYNKSLELYDPVKDRQSIGIVYNNLGSMYRALGQYDKALDYFGRSLEIREALGDVMGQAINHINMGIAYNSKGDYRRARAEVETSIRLFKDLRDDASLANCYSTLCSIAFNEGNYRECIQWCEASQAIAAKVGKLVVQIDNHRYMYRAHKVLGRPAEALTHFEQMVMLTDSLKADEMKIAMARLEMGNQHLADSLAQEEEKARLQLTHQQELGRKNRLTMWILGGGFFVLLLALFFLGGMLYFQRSSETLKTKTRELERQQLINEISLLRTQVNPHFLFNSLSILSSLVRVDPELSEKFIDQLSKSYRYILEQREQSLVTLRTELGFIESYAFLLGIRFEHKFRLDIRIPEEVLDRHKIAPLTLQLLIENAVKHNRMSVQEPLVISIGLEVPRLLVVKNKLQPRTTPTHSTGLGLQNIISRYALLTDQVVWAGESDGFFVVKIPLLHESAADEGRPA